MRPPEAASPLGLDLDTDEPLMNDNSQLHDNQSQGERLHSTRTGRGATELDAPIRPSLRQFDNTCDKSQWNLWTCDRTTHEPQMHSEGTSYFHGQLDVGGMYSKTHADDMHHPHAQPYSCLPPVKADLINPASSSSVPLQCSNTGTTKITLSDNTIARGQPALLNSAPPRHAVSPVQFNLPDDQYFLSKEAAFIDAYPRFSRIDKPSGHLEDMYLDTIQALVHPDDWRPFVLGTIDFSLVRFHAEFMTKPPHLAHKLSFEFESNWIRNLSPQAIPITDDMCTSLNRRLYVKNSLTRKNNMIQSRQSAGSKRIKLFRYVTLISDKHMIQGCRGEVPTHDSPAPPEAQPAPPPVVDIHSEEALTISAVREKCDALMSSAESTYDLCKGVCRYEPSDIKLMRAFDELTTNEFFSFPKEVIRFDYDRCDASCTKTCTMHGLTTPAGICPQCNQPLVVVAQKLHVNAGSFGTDKVFDVDALLMKRVCQGSRYCPDSKGFDKHPNCDNAAANSYASKGEPSIRHISKNMWIHKLLVDVLVAFQKSPDVVSEYMLAFRRAVLLRHINLFHQARFAQERDNLKIKKGDYNSMTHALFQRADGMAHDECDTGAMADALDTPAFKKRKVEFQTQSKRRMDNSNPYGRSSWA